MGKKFEDINAGFDNYILLFFSNRLLCIWNPGRGSCLSCFRACIGRIILDRYIGSEEKIPINLDSHSQNSFFVIAVSCTSIVRGLLH